VDKVRAALTKRRKRMMLLCNSKTTILDYIVNARFEYLIPFIVMKTILYDNHIYFIQA
jgi:hypothetical protein